MTAGCGTVNPDALVRSLLAVADCQATMLGDEGWHALATGGMFAAVLTGLLTLAVARQGYRLLMAGGGIAPAEWTALLLRFGIVLALTTSWAAYDRLIYRVAMDGPAELAGTIFPAAGIQTRALPARLQNAYDMIATPPLADETAPVAPQRQSETAVSPGAAPVGEGLPGTDRRSAATVLVVTGAGSWMAARFALALLLAIGPFAIVAALFEASVGLCIGWLRALIGCALACLVIPLAIALELQMLEGPVRAATRAGTADIPGIGVIVWSFALVIAALLFAVQRLAGGLRLPRALAQIATPPVSGASSGIVTAGIVSGAGTRTTAIAPPVPVAPSRAMAIARAVEPRIATGDRPGAPPPRTLSASSAIVPAGGSSQRGLDLLDSARRTTAGRRTLPAQRLEAR